jgi:CubicO group peptidase (beta-lactamase class C family)
MAAMFTRTALLTAVAFTVAVGAAPVTQGLPQATPASVGMDAATLAKGVDLYREAVARDDIRGAVLYVARRGKVVLHEAVGFRHHGYRLPMEKDTLFRMASNTKPVIAAAVLLLVEEGKLSLSDRAGKYLTSFDNDKSRAITIEQLLTHSSGLRIGPIALPFKEGEEQTLQNAVSKFGAIGPEAAPGAYSYNNAGYNTLGALIELCSGQPLEAFLKSRFYVPLGMIDSLNHEDPAKLHRMATVYRGQRGAGGTVTFTQGFTPDDAPDFSFIRASGGMISTASDYARFLEMYRLGGLLEGRRVLRVESARAAVQPRVKMNDSSSYGYGWMVRSDGTYSHTGSDGTMAWVDPGRELFGMVLTQSPGGNNPTAQFRLLVEQSVKPRVSF